MAQGLEPFAEVFNAEFVQEWIQPLFDHFTFAPWPPLRSLKKKPLTFSVQKSTKVLS